MGWWWVAATVALGAVVAFRLRKRTYRYTEATDRHGVDTLFHHLSPWWVPAWAGVGAVLAGPFWAHLPLPLLVTGVLALVWSATLVLIDFEVRRLPDVLTLPAYPVLAALLVWCSAITEDWEALLRAAACSGSAVLLTMLLHLVSAKSQGFGAGDVKLLGVTSALLGWFAWPAAVLGMTAGIVVGGLVACVLLVVRRGARKSHFALGPYLVVGAYLIAAVLPVTS